MAAISTRKSKPDREKGAKGGATTDVAALMDVLLTGYRRHGLNPRPAALEFNWRLITTAAARQAFFVQQLRAFGMPGVIAQYGVLRDIYFSDYGSLTQTQIMRIRLVSSANVTRLIHGLEQAGLVRREVNPEDKRSTIVRLTEAGLELCERLIPAIGQDIDLVYDCFSDAELGLLNELLARLRAHLDQDLNVDKLLTHQQNLIRMTAGMDDD